LKGSIKVNFPGLWKIITAVKGKKEAQGYYTWRDPDGKMREKFMVCTPIEGTNFVIAATTYIDEFNQPMKELKLRAIDHITRATNITLLVSIVALIVFGLVVSLFGHKLTGKINQLTTAADRISVGELDFEIKVKSNDEIGGLAEAITRMRDSIRIYKERLRRKRGM
jgi:methyl-accepting chemotaxis protein